MIKKLMTELMKLPYLNVASPTLKTRLEKSILPAKIPSRGLIKFFTKDCTIAVKAAPMITPTAMSITFPREINSLNSLIMLYSYI